MSVVRYEQQGAIVQITVDRPAQLNAINKGVRKGLYEAFERFEADENAYVAILTGSGVKAFCAGMDLKDAAQNALDVPPRGFLPIIGDSLAVTKPTIAVGHLFDRVYRSAGAQERPQAFRAKRKPQWKGR